jgi:hypothetical protein
MTSTTSERAAINAAADRLLIGHPLHSNGQLTVVQLAIEAGVKRWVLTHKHRDLAQDFQARVRAIGGDPAPVQALKDEINQLKQDNTRLRAANAEAQALVEHYAHIINELDTELAHVTAERDQLLGNIRSISTAPSHPGRRADPAH